MGDAVGVDRVDTRVAAVQRAGSLQGADEAVFEHGVDGFGILRADILLVDRRHDLEGAVVIEIAERRRHDDLGADPSSRTGHQRDLVAAGG